jgi:hypothetical protein
MRELLHVRSGRSVLADLQALRTCAAIVSSGRCNLLLRGGARSCYDESPTVRVLAAQQQHLNLSNGRQLGLLQPCDRSETAR